MIGVCNYFTILDYELQPAIIAIPILERFVIEIQRLNHMVDCLVEANIFQVELFLHSSLTQNKWKRTFSNK
jgi:hypothetical protein